MFEQLHRASLYVLYQTSLVLGIALLPVALVARQAGISLPIHRVVRSLRNAYDEVPAESR